MKLGHQLRVMKGWFEKRISFEVLNLDHDKKEILETHGRTPMRLSFHLNHHLGKTNLLAHVRGFPQPESATWMQISSSWIMIFI